MIAAPYEALADQFGLVTAGDPWAWAIFSKDEMFRYALGRVWEPDRPIMIACLLNPSKATHTATDPTLKKVCHFAQREDFGGTVLVNAFALRSTEPRKLRDCYQAGIDPIGVHNDAVIRFFMTEPLGAMAVAGWGSPSWACLRPRLNEMKAARYHHPWICWGRNKDGHPKHPLYLKNETAMEQL